MMTELCQQATIVLVMSVIVNIPRWFEFDYEIAQGPML
jgi:hypothetical protein